MIGRRELPPTYLPGASLGQVLVHLCEVAGLQFRAVRERPGVEFYRPGSTHVVVGPALQPAGQDLDRARSNLHQCDLTISEPARPTILARGERKHIEATLELQPGWDPNLQTSRWRDFVRSLSGDWASNAAVYRRWVLNEAGQYSPAPWLLSRWHGNGLDAAFDYPLRRRFLPCLSADASGRSRGIVVEYSTDDGSVWRRWNGPVWTAEDECTVYLGGDALPGAYFQAANNGTLKVRVTATLRADQRLELELPGDPGGALHTRNFSDQAGWRAIHPNSIFYNAAHPAERQDLPFLTAHAQELQEQLTASIEGTLVLGWVHLGLEVGDAVDGIEGRNVEFASHSNTAVCINAVRHDFQAQTTTLEIGG